MGLLEQGIAKIPGLGDLLNRKAPKPAFKENDFPDGLTISEIVNGVQSVDPRNVVKLRGVFAPHVPFSYGGEQRIIKEYYAGNAEPSLQILGDKESSVTIKGRLKSKFFKKEDFEKNESLRAIADTMATRLSEIRTAGRILLITLGEWKRYAVLESSKFDMRNLTDVDYELTFLIIGEKPPVDAKLKKNPDDNIKAANRDLLNSANALIDGMKKVPTQMPRTFAELISDAIGEVASVISAVTGFVEGVVDDAEKISKSVNKAVGLIKNARATVSRMNRRVGAISIASLGDGSPDEKKASAETINKRYIGKYQRDSFAINLLLAQLQARFAFLKQSTPGFRHLVKDGDTLQKIAIKYYNNADLWKSIQDHNKLTSPNLVKGTVLEIPKQ